MSVSGPPKHQKLIPFNIPAITGHEIPHITNALESSSLADNGTYTRRCETWLETHLSSRKALLTPSGTASLTLAALILDLKPADEVILPSYTHVSTANAFILRGASPVFIDIVPETMNLNIELLREAITEKTRAVVVVHYGGVSSEMDAIAEMTRARGIYIVEDAAEALFSTYRGRHLGSIGHLGCLSFHGSENLTAGGQGGAILVNDAALLERAETLRDKGLVRSGGLRSTDERVYAWQTPGDNYLLSELQAAYLWAQLQAAETIQIHRHRIWNLYWKELQPLAALGLVELPALPPHCDHNARMFFVKVQDGAERRELMEAMKEVGVTVLPHYTPLHKAGPGVQYRYVVKGEDVATRESERLVCLPIYYALTLEDAWIVADNVRQFYSGKVR